MLTEAQREMLNIERPHTRVSANGPSVDLMSMSADPALFRRWIELRREHFPYRKTAPVQVAGKG